MDIRFLGSSVKERGFRMKNKKRIVIGFVVVLFCLISSACAHSDGPYKGKVVELETGNPIERAVVAASWSIEEVPHAQKICDAEETVTDKNGEFVLPKGSCVSHPFAKIFGPYVIVFKPGYLGYPPLGHNEEEKRAHMPNWGKPRLFKDKKQYNVIELGRPKTREERELTLDHADFPIHDEVVEKLPNLIKLINEERKNLGFKGEVYRKEKKNEK